MFFFSLKILEPHKIQIVADSFNWFYNDSKTIHYESFVAHDIQIILFLCMLNFGVYFEKIASTWSAKLF
jgi:hypothetical protein